MPGIDETMFPPGASSDTNGAMFEKLEIVSSLSTDPTLIAVETQAGLDSAERWPALPAATMLGMPSERRLSIAGLYGSPSHPVVKSPPPRLRLTATTFRCTARVWT